MRTPSPRESSPPAAGASVVLVVEDEPVLRTSMVRGLAKLPCVEVLAAGTLADARKLIAAYPPALLISDLDLPDGSGVELAADLERGARGTPIVFVTAYMNQFRALLPERPGVEVHEKPLALAQLRQIVLALLGTRERAAPPFGVLDYVQLAGMSRRSIVLEVRGQTSGHGRVIVRQGELWSAEDERGVGLDAFRRLAFLPTSEISCRAPGEADARPRDLAGSVEAVLIEVARQHDEAVRDAASDDASADAGPLPTSILDELADGWEPSPRTSHTSGTHVRADFRDLVDQGVEALLAKRHAEAYRHFVAANDVRPNDPSVVANLTRLREMGYAC